MLVRQIFTKVSLGAQAIQCDERDAPQCFLCQPTSKNNSAREGSTAGALVMDFQPCQEASEGAATFCAQGRIQVHYDDGSTSILTDAKHYIVIDQAWHNGDYARHASGVGKAVSMCSNGDVILQWANGKRNPIKPTSLVKPLESETKEYDDLSFDRALASWQWCIRWHSTFSGGDGFMMKQDDEWLLQSWDFHHSIKRLQKTTTPTPCSQNNRTRLRI